MKNDMCIITGKVLLFTDLHLGLQNNSISKLNIAIRAMKEIISYIKANDVKTVLFLGDWNHSRVTTENNILNASYKLMSALQSVASVKMIVGNHDIYMKNSVDINSLVIFKDLPNVEIIDKTVVANINGNHSLLVPWLGDMSAYKPETFDMMFGHFDVSSKYLIKSYIEDHKNSLPASQKDAGDEIGDFVDVVKKDVGVIFSGHIHGRREFTAKGRKFMFIGSPYQQNLGEIGNLCGFYVLNEDMTYGFHEITSAPKHIKLRMSDVASNIEAFDFSAVRGNIVQKVYDVEVDSSVDAIVSQRISDMKPFEELLPEYDIEVKSESNDKSASQSIELLKKSKLEYIKNYIDNIDDKALDDCISKDQLRDILEKYYDMVTQK